MNTLMEGVIRQAKTRRRSVTRHQRVWFQRKGVPLRGKAALLSKRRKKQRPGRLTPTLKENAPSLRRVFAMVEFELRKRRRWAVVNKGVKIHRGFKKPPIIRVLPRLQRPLAPFQEFHDLTETTYSSLQRVSKIQYSLDQYFQNWLGVHQVIKLQTPFDLFSRKRLYQGEQTLFSVRAFFRQKYFKQLLYALKVGQHHLNPQLVAVLITDELKRTRKQHRQIARNVSIMLADLRPSYIKGFKLRITGKFDGKDESTSEWFNSYKSPEVPTQQFNKRFGYSLESVCTYTGLFGVKLWIYY